MNGAVKYDYIVSLDMAKELCMISKTEMGKRLRKYFIEVEKQYQSVDPETVNKLRTIILTEYPRSKMTVGQQVDELLKQYHNLQQENKILLEQQYITNRTYCISDITQKFKDIEPFEGQSILWQRGILEHRQNGMFPSEYYDHHQCV